MPHWKDVLDTEARGGRYLAWKEVARATGLSRTTAWRLQKRGEFPAPYAISPGRVGYREDEVEAWRVSRDHSTARVRSPPDDNRDLPATEAPSAAPSRAEVPDPAVAARAPAEVVAPPGSAPPMTRPSLRPTMGDASARRGKAGRRRSQHAQAIAQQILFDF